MQIIVRVVNYDGEFSLYVGFTRQGRDGNNIIINMVNIFNNKQIV